MMTGFHDAMIIFAWRYRSGVESSASGRPGEWSFLIQNGAGAGEEPDFENAINANGVASLPGRGKLNQQCPPPGAPVAPFGTSWMAAAKAQVARRGDCLRCHA